MRTIKNLIGAVLISSAMFVFWVVILPDYDSRAYLQAAVEARVADLQAKSDLINKVDSLDKEYQSRYAELKRLALVIPPEKHIDEMITIVQDIFSATGVPLKEISLSPQEGQADYNPIGMEFNLNGSYDSVINFLNAVEKSLRLIDVTSLRMGINKEESNSSGQLTLGVSMQAKAYFLSKSSPAKSTVKPAGGSEE